MEAGERLAKALHRSISRVTDIVKKHGEGEACYLNVAVTDGDHAVVSRFTDEPGQKPESLYYFTGELYPLELGANSSGSINDPVPVIVSSERLTEGEDWQEVPPNHIVIVRRYKKPELIHCGTGHS